MYCVPQETLFQCTAKHCHCFNFFGKPFHQKNTQFASGVSHIMPTVMLLSPLGAAEMHGGHESTLHLQFFDDCCVIGAELNLPSLPCNCTIVCSNVVLQECSMKAVRASLFPQEAVEGPVEQSLTPPHYDTKI